MTRTFRRRGAGRAAVSALLTMSVATVAIADLDELVAQRMSVNGEAVGIGNSHSLNLNVNSVTSVCSMSRQRLRQIETHLVHLPQPVQFLPWEPSPSQERGLQPT